LNAIKNERYVRIKTYSEGLLKKRLANAKKSWDKVPITTERLSSDLDELLDDDAIIVTEPVYGSPQWFDLGHGRKTLVGASPGEVLGWATGVGLGAKLARPDSQVVCLTGDGAFMFQHSLWSLSRYDAPIIVVVYNNRCYNLSRAFSWMGGGAQSKMGKDLAAYLGDPDVDFSLIAKAYGVDAEVVENPSEIKPAIKRAIKATKDGKPYLLDVVIERWGPGGELTWHPDISIAAMRSKEM
jgi:acetolactate synthase-1/2/3 large subunit